jgi:hypothetical protein
VSTCPQSHPVAPSGVHYAVRVVASPRPATKPSAHPVSPGVPGTTWPWDWR